MGNHINTNKRGRITACNKHRHHAKKQTSKTGNLEERIKKLKSLDAILRQPNSGFNGGVARYYSDMVNHVFYCLGHHAIKQGIRVWKLYASSFIVQTPRCNIALDFCEGPNSDLFGKTSPAFSLTRRQIEQFAGLVKYSFHTHQHHDHISYFPTAALARRRRKIFITQENLRLWKKEPFAKNMSVLKEGTTVFEDLEVETLYGCQHMESGQVECYAYNIKIGDIRILVKGDIFDGREFAVLCDKLPKAAKKVDLYLSSSWTANGPDIIQQVTRKFDPFFIPAHEWEFTHRPADTEGVATQSYGDLIHQFKTKIKHNKATVLSWGEAIEYIHKGCSSDRAPVDSRARDKDPKPTGN